ncbi:MAG: phosphoribosylglycinamide formyltransferase [Coriobacteriales bacterium]|nr:phosphoribosylglycinamide formyltransferase [Coriobacteriales bacterium]
MTIKLGVLISGSGTNLQAIIDAIAAGTLDASVQIVIASKPEAYGLVRAREALIPTMNMTREAYAEPDLADAVIAMAMRNHDVDYVVMAGYMRKVGANILDAFPTRVINIHPALLPSFVGAHAMQDAWNHGVKVSGITVHFANAEYDRGPIIAQEPVRIEPGMSFEDFEAAMHKVEHKLYPQVLQWIAEDRVRVTVNDAGRSVVQVLS